VSDRPTQADWLAIGLIFRDIHQRRARKKAAVQPRLDQDDKATTNK
jgi:hypothetical protein